MSMADGDAPLGESQFRPLGFFGKATPCSAHDTSLFKKLLLVGYWVQVDTQWLTTEYQVTM